ncbi:PEGA domain-containing protein [Candidatus Poribacteria bacterium]|nr:PEGA domain-containing protein [Candidatus Poribacteria bacterium]
MTKKTLLVLFFIVLINPNFSYCQQNGITWDGIKTLVTDLNLSDEKKIEIIKNSGIDCNSTFPEDYPLKLILYVKNKLIIDAIIEEVNKCRSNLTIITKPVNALIYMEREKKGESNNSGIFEVKVKPGQYLIKASKEGYYDSVRTVMIEKQETIFS